MINITPIQVSSRINARKKKSSNTLYSEELKSFCEKKGVKTSFQSAFLEI